MVQFLPLHASCKHVKHTRCEPCLATLPGHLFLETLFANCSCKPVLADLAWEHVVQNLAWESVLRNLAWTWEPVLATLLRNLFSGNLLCNLFLGTLLGNLFSRSLVVQIRAARTGRPQASAVGEILALQVLACYYFVRSPPWQIC